jgi:small subunit ribosomal protein S17
MTDETPETTDEQAPDAVTEEPAAEAAPETTEAVADEAPAADEAPEAAAPAAAAEPVALPTPKERKLASRARRGQRRPATPEERAEIRKAKAVARSRRRKQEREKARAARAENPAQPTPPAEHGEGSPKVRQGIVVSDKADKTITVRVDMARRHRRYEKIVRSSATLHVHDENNDAGTGDTVRVVEARPLSRTKRWRLVEILERAK